MIKQGWIHTPAEPGRYGYYQYYVDDMAVMLFVAHWEVVDGHGINSYYCRTGKKKSLVRGPANRTVKLPDYPFAGDAEAVKKYLETLYLTGAIDAYV